MANPRGATLEQKMMGNRPEFGSISDSKQRKLALIKALNFHAFYFDGKKDFPVFEKFIKSLPGFSSEDLKAIHSVSSARLNPTVMSLIKMINDGWIPSASELEQIKNHAVELVEFSKKPPEVVVASSDVEDRAVEPVVLKKSEPQHVIRSAVFSILQSFDTEEESWFTRRSIPIADPLDLFKASVFDAKLNGAEFKTVLSFFEKRREEYSGAYNKTDEDLSEGYSKFGQRLLGVAIRRIGMYIDALNEGHEKVRVVKKAKKVSTVAVVKKSSKTAKIDQQLKSLRFLPASSEYNVSSIDPKKVIGGRILITFNTKSRIASFFHSSAPEGFSFRGTTLQGFDPGKSKSRGIRKPNDFIQILKTKTIPQVEVEWNSLKTIEREASGRINEDTLFLRVL